MSLRAGCADSALVPVPYVSRHQRPTGAAIPHPPMDHRLTTKRVKEVHRSMPRIPSRPRSPTARSHLGQVLDQLIRLASLGGTDTASAMGLSAQHLSALVTGEEFPSRLLTERLARVCGADPMILLKVWDDERCRRSRPT